MSGKLFVFRLYLINTYLGIISDFILIRKYHVLKLNNFPIIIKRLGFYHICNESLVPKLFGITYTSRLITKPFINLLIPEKSLNFVGYLIKKDGKIRSGNDLF